MTSEQVTKLINGLKAAGISEYQFSTDLGTHYYNNEAAFNLIDTKSESVLNIRSRDKIATPAYSQGICVYLSDFGDIHEARFGATADQAKKFIESYGLSLDDDQLKILLELDNDNYTINPRTGNYIFTPLTPEEIEKLSDEEKAEYEKNREKYSPDLRKGTAARIDY